MSYHAYTVVVFQTVFNQISYLHNFSHVSLKLQVVIQPSARLIHLITSPRLPPTSAIIKTSSVPLLLFITKSPIFIRPPSMCRNNALCLHCSRPPHSTCPHRGEPRRCLGLCLPLGLVWGGCQALFFLLSLQHSSKPPFVWVIL